VAVLKLGRRSVLAFVVVVVALAAMATVPAGSSLSRASRHRPPVPSHKLIQQGPITFWECSAKTTRVLVGVSSLTLHPGDPLNINFIVRNEGTTPCGYVVPVSSTGGAAAGTLGMGPCGAIGFEILGPHNRMVWPGVKTFNCPALTYAQLAANGVAVGSGSWDQTPESGTGRVAPGQYVLMVDDHYAYALRIAKT
jgi:hypothetical protein